MDELLSRIKEGILEELKRRERNGWWDLKGKESDLVTAGALYLLHLHGHWNKRWEHTVAKLVKKAESVDLETLRYVLLLIKRLGMDTSPVDRRLNELFDEEKKLWSVTKGFSGDPLTSSAMLVAMKVANHHHPLTSKVLEGIEVEDRLPRELEALIGGQRPVLTSLYRALALALHGRVEKAKKIWKRIKEKELADKPPKYLLDEGVKKDEHYPAVLAAFLARELGEDPHPYLEPLKGFKPEEWDNARLVTIGFYLSQLRRPSYQTT